MWRSMMLLSAMKSVPHTPSRSSSRVTTWPARLASTYSRLCSMLLRWMTDVAGPDLAAEDVDLDLADL